MLTETQGLLEQLHGGDPDALARLVARDLSWVRQRVEQRMGAFLRGHADPEDVVQEAMMRVLRDGPRFSIADMDECRALVARIVENVLRNENRWLRRQQRDAHRAEPLASASALELSAGATSPSRAAARNEDAAWIRLGVELLTERDSEVVTLRDFEGLPFRQIAERLAANEDAVRIRYHRAVGRLARIVERLQRGEVNQVLEAAEPDPPGES